MVMHKTVKDERSRQAQRYRARPHHEQQVYFSVGDYMLRSQADRKLHANNLRVIWVGPYRIVGSADYYFTVEHLVTGHKMDLHPSCLKLYADSSFQITEELLDQIASRGTLLAVEIKWWGLETIEDSWEPLKTMKEDIPRLLLEYAQDAEDGIILTTVTQGTDTK
ncbi:Chromodomain containing hypothetical protein [Phytophthora palmivora]|uniref:Chromo domain-containing protein n=1 Tax=Phytophthora palmivora TaxID=4796 RepID=A0A2P4X4R2_9STRA|nr:Chromodomain containing hypothetical protein [Phytophthora palmivora]